MSTSVRPVALIPIPAAAVAAPLRGGTLPRWIAVPTLVCVIVPGVRAGSW